MSRFLSTARLALSLALVLAPGLGVAGVSGSDAHAQYAHGSDALPHEAHVAAATEESALPARRWSPDAPLSRGMQRVRAATSTLEHGSHGHLDAAQVRKIAAELKSAVETMFAQCKLEPEPDAALHPLLARVLVASNTLAEAGFDAGALAELQAVLARYPLIFDDPSWEASAVN